MAKFSKSTVWNKVPREVPLFLNTNRKPDAARSRCVPLLTYYATVRTAGSIKQCSGPSVSELSMGWVDPLVGLGWVQQVSLCDAAFVLAC